MLQALLKTILYILHSEITDILLIYNPCTNVQDDVNALSAMLLNVPFQHTFSPANV